MDLDECSLWVVPSMAWVPPGLGIYLDNLTEEDKTEEGAPNDFKLWRAARQKVISGGKNRPIVEKEDSKRTELGTTH